MHLRGALYVYNGATNTDLGSLALATKFQPILHRYLGSIAVGTELAEGSLADPTRVLRNRHNRVY